MSQDDVHDRPNRRRGPMTVLLSFALAIGGLVYAAPESQAQTAQDAEAPGEDETAVYVIRKKSMVGAARKVWVGVNDQVLANLGSGKVAYFKVPAGINTINLVQEKIPLAYLSLDDRGGETVYLYYLYLKGQLDEIDQAEGKALVRKSKRMPDIGDPRPNDGYPQGLLNPGYLDLELMKAADMGVEPDAEHAAITFIRGKNSLEQLRFGIWGEDRFLGNLGAQSFLEIKVPAGEHMFFGLSEQWAVLRAEVAAGKRYYVRVEAGRGRWKARLELLAGDARLPQSELDTWLATSKRLALDESAITDTIQKRLDAALPLIAATRDSVRDGQMTATALKPEAAR